MCTFLVIHKGRHVSLQQLIFVAVVFVCWFSLSFFFLFFFLGGGGGGGGCGSTKFWAEKLKGNLSELHTVLAQKFDHLVHL